MRKLLLIAFILGISTIASAQVPVSVGPPGVLQFFDQNGAVLAGGLLCTFSSGTNTPLNTYADPLGTVPNSDPIVLDSAGRAVIYFQASAYRLLLAGGGSCGSPSNLQWTLDGFQVGIFASGNNVWTGNNTFSGTTTFSGPIIATGGGTLNGSFAGNPNFSGNPTFTGTIIANQFQSTVATGTPPFVVASNTFVPNLNVAYLDGIAYPANAVQSSVPIVTVANSNATYEPLPDCQDTLGNHLNYVQATFTFNCGTSTATLPQTIQSNISTPMSGDVAIMASTPTTLITQAVTMPSIGGPWRVLVSYNLNFTNSGVVLTSDAVVSDGSNAIASSQASGYYTGAGPIIFGQNASQMSPVTYANGATVTFTLLAEADQNYTAKLAPFNALGQNSSMSLSVLSSN